MIRKRQSSEAGLVCRRCGCRDFRVVKTRKLRPNWITRRRQCRHCGRRITTQEREVGTV